jgi:hypothetical protein
MTDISLDLDSIPDFLQCCVCLDPVVCPYSFGCGHTVDAQCFVQLRKSECPKCRFKFGNVKKYGINLMLEGLLREKIPNYDELAKRQMKYVKSVGLFKNYRRSERYEKIASLCDEFINTHNYAVKLSDLYEHIIKELLTTEASAAVSEASAARDKSLEIRYVLSKDSEYHRITTTDGDDYVVNLEGEETMGNVLRELKDKIDELTIIKLLSWTFGADDEVVHSGLNMHKTPFITDEDNDRLIDYLLDLGEKINIPKEAKSRSNRLSLEEISSSSEAEPDPDSEDSDSESELETMFIAIQTG